MKFFTFYLPHSGKSIYDIEKSVQELNVLVTQAKNVVLNDYKQHIIAFGLEHDNRVFDVDLPDIPVEENTKAYRKAITVVIKEMCKTRPKYWQVVRSDASVTYADLQRRGVLYGYELQYPIWGRTYSGRSKTTNFNVQGLGQEHLMNVNNDKIYLNFDWVAADMRAVAIMSGDKKLNAAFVDSDPYQVLIDHFNSGVEVDKLNRGEGKRLMFKSVYSFDSDNPALDFYGGFKAWISECRARLRRDGYLKSILGRKFSIAKDRTEKSVFNATVQGSVAHAMQVCLRRVWDLFPDNILTENHDSLAITCSKDDAKAKIIEVSRIMVQPFKGILKSNPQFPVKVSIGSGYKKWNNYRRYNCYEQIR